MERTAGVLLHPTCLPSPHGIGDLGPTAHDYIGWLREAGVTWWQVLPLHPPGPGRSPYSAVSTYAGSPWLISPELLVEDGLLVDGDLAGAPAASSNGVDFDAVREWKWRLLSRAWEAHRRHPSAVLEKELEDLRHRFRAWLPDYSLYAALKEEHGGAPWYGWSQPLARREPSALTAARAELAERVELEDFLQLLFFRQWSRLRHRAAELGVRILGDVPIFVAMDSAEVWARPDLFKLDPERRPTVVAGVPPDYFSATGQLWGNPVYDWARHAADGFRWWVDRMRHALELADAVRLDHFRGFAAFWEVPAGDPDATGGRWAPGPGRALFDALAAALSGLPLVAEDLGEITPDVIALRDDLGLPGMAILQFGFQPEPRSSFIPYRHQRELVVYTGTHDNNTSRGWYDEEATEGERDLLRRYAGSDGSAIHWDMVRLALASVADLAVVPHQDLLGLGSESRMNRPGVGDGNWGFRLPPDGLAPDLAARLRDLVHTYGRLP